MQYIRCAVYSVVMTLRDMLFKVIRRLDGLDQERTLGPTLLGTHEAVDTKAHGRSDVEFNKWYGSILSRVIRIPLKKKPEVRIIDLRHDFYRPRMLEPYVDVKAGTVPLDSIMEIIPSANRYLRQCNREKAFKTFIKDRCHRGGALPSGLHVYTAPMESIGHIEDKALTDIERLFKNQITNRNPRILMLNPHTKPTNTILFYSRDEKQPAFLEVIKLLEEHTPDLSEYILIYCSIIMKILKIDESELEKCQMSLVHYDANAGLNPHIDSIHQFGDTIGPIATISMGRRVKYFDMLPTLMTDGSPVRIALNPNEITFMDGLSRIAWSH
jgi:hypothetical protein